MEIKLLAKGYKNNEEFYQDFLNDRLKNNEAYFSGKTVFIKEAPDFPIYLAIRDQQEREEAFLKAFDIISNYYLNLNREIILEEEFWHSLLVTEKREYLIESYPQIKDSIKEFNNVVLKKFDWENYIYKCVLGAQYIVDRVADPNQRTRYFKLIINNLDVYNYIIKYEIFRNDCFLINVLDIIDELGISEILKAKITDRDDLGKDERYGRRVIFEFNKSYPIIMSPMLSKDDLKEKFVEYLGYYYDISQLTQLVTTP